MLSIVFNYYYESIFTGFFEFISDTLSQETFGVDYKEALILYYETQAWSAFQETLVEHHILVSYSYKWAVASYLKNLAAMNGIFDEIELAQEAMGIGWFELMTSSYGATFKHDPNKTYSDFGAAMTETAGIGSDFLSAVLGAGLGDEDSLRTALVSEGFTNVEVAAFIDRMAEVFTYQSLQSLKDTFAELLDEGTPDSLIGMLTTPVLAEDIEDMVGVMIAHHYYILGTILSSVDISEEIATPVILWLYAAYMQSFAAINDIAVEPGSIPPDDYPIKNYTAKEELTRTGITVAFAEAQGVDVELVEVDETTMQALLDVILARDLADLGLMFNGTLLHKGTTASDFLLFSMLCLLFGSENEEFDVFSIVSVLQTTASFPFDDLFTELDAFDSLLENEVDIGVDNLGSSARRISSNLANYLLESWEAIRQEAGALFDEGDDTLDYVLAWVTTLYLQNYAELNAEEFPLIKGSSPISKQKRLENEGVKKQLVTESQLNTVVECPVR